MTPSDNLKELKALHNLGFSLIWLHPKQKRPIGDGWTRGPRKTWEELKSEFKPGYNVGVRLGETSKIGEHYLCCIDVDIKDPAYKETALAKLKEITKDAYYPTVLSGSGNGACHLYGVSVHPFSMVEVEKHKGKWEICIYSTGRQMVLPPSTHPNGKSYRWKNSGAVQRLPVLSGFQNKRSVPDKNDSDLGAFRAIDVDLYSSKLSLRMIKLIENGDNVQDRSAALFSIAMAMCRAQFTDNEILSVLSDSNHSIAQAALERRGNRASAVDWLRKYVLERARYETHPMRLFENKPELLPPTQKEMTTTLENIASDHDWKMDLQTNKEGGYRNTLKNLELILTNVQHDQVFVHDDFSTRDSYGTDTSWGGKKDDHLTDIDLIKIRHWTSGTSFKIDPGKDLVLDTVKLIADRNRTHPVRTWLENLKWDGKPRINGWIKKYCKGNADEPYMSEVSRLFLLAMIKRVFEPGCQWDYTVVLEGKQGTFKSTTARVLAGDNWFMDNLPDLRDKDVMLNLQGKWIIELGELADVKRGDYNLVKAYLNRRVDRVRSPYDKLPADIPRQSVFLGTVNEGEYLKDPTGNRRFWPVSVGTCDVDGLKGVREQLFAEAMWQYNNVFDGKLKLSEEANKQASSAQDDRRINDDSTEMEEALREFMVKCESKPAGQKLNLKRFRIKELFGMAGPWGDWEGKRYIFQVGAQVLHKMGFNRSKIEGQRVWKIGADGADPLDIDEYNSGA
jgi:predicted P-loop ATPase